jgi:preprotein translocase subunit SecG
MNAFAAVLETGSTAGWTIGYVITVVVVLVVVALVVPILLLAHKIGGQAAAIDESLQQSVTNTAGLAQLNTTIDHATEIIGGLTRGRKRLGG